MSKIRINELARELEVKPGVIIDILPELGVADKKTHSSSLDDDIALQLRRRLTGEGAHSGSEAGSMAEASEHEVDARPAPHRETVPASAPEAVKPHHTGTEHISTERAGAEHAVAEPSQAGLPFAASPVTPSVAPPITAPVTTPSAAIPPTANPGPSAEKTVDRRSAFPLRPPLASGQSNVPHSTPSVPIINRAPAIQARPAPPAPKPGQILSGPRQPMPGSTETLRSGPSVPLASAPQISATPAAPAIPGGTSTGSGQVASGPTGNIAPPAVFTTPGAPRPGPALSAPALRQPLRPSSPPSPGAVLPPAGQVTSGGAPLRPPARPNAPGQRFQGQHPTGQHPTGQRPGQQSMGQPTGQHLAGQPAARPVVPPRPDMVARLAKPAMPSAPGLPRPGVPASRPSSPVPGRPIYTGPVRPGQPLTRGPGGPTGSSYPGSPRPGGSSYPGGPRPGGSYSGGPARGRPMHPTSPLRAEPATLPTDPGRRHATKPGTRDPRRRDADPEEGRIRQVSRRQESFQPPPIDREITIAEGVTVKELSEKLGIKANVIVKRLVERKIFATINQTLDVKMAEDLARDFGASTNKVSYEEETTQDIQQTEVDQDREKRPPVVTIMGHVDHGKTSLLDAIRSANVAGREAGGITQHIGAYHVEKNGKNIVFIDTPGHEAFTRMRARGAKVTDIVVLVVAADDGVMPQTLEAIDHAKAAGVPIIVAINKIDRPDAQPERIKQQLSDRGLLAEDWGGDTVMVPVSAKAKTGLDLLLEMILLVTEMLDLKANPLRPAMGTVLEAKLDRGRGPVPTVLVRNGTLRVGDYFICGSVFGRVRAMFDDSGAPVREVGPSMPAEVLGLESLPEVGDTMQVVTDTAKAKQIVIYRESKAREVAMSKNNRITLDQLHDQMKEGEIKELNIILKTDVGGTAEVLTDTLQKLSNDKVKIRVLHAGVGAITETDVLLASASNAIIVGFNVRPDRTAQAVAEQEKVDIRMHTIIYELVDQIKKAMTGMLEPVFKEVYKGRAQVREVYRISKVGAVAGCQVDDGSITRNSEVRLLRDGKVIFTGKIDSLKRFKNDASEVKSGFECGISLTNFNDLKPGDVIEAYATERVAVEALA